MFLVALLYALFASVFTIAKTGLAFSQPLFFVGSRMLIAGIFMLCYLFLFKRDQLTFNRVHFGLFFRLALFNIYLTNVFEFWGLQYLTSFKTCFIYSLSPFFSALLSYWMFKDKMSKKKWIGLLIGFIGFMPILLNETTAEELSGQIFFLSGAEIAVVCAAAFAVYGWVVLKQLVKDNGYSPFMANGLSMTMGGAMALVHSYFAEPWDPVPVTEFWPFIECALLLVAISSFICYNLYGYLLKRYSVTFVSFAGFITPFFSALFGWVYLGETVTWPFWLSAAIVFIGLYTFNQEELSELYASSENQLTTTH